MRFRDYHCNFPEIWHFSTKKSLQNPEQNASHKVEYCKCTLESSIDPQSIVFIDDFFKRRPNKQNIRIWTTDKSIVYEDTSKQEAQKIKAWQIGQW